MWGGGGEERGGSILPPPLNVRRKIGNSNNWNYCNDLFSGNSIKSDKIYFGTVPVRVSEFGRKLLRPQYLVPNLFP